MRRVWAGEIVVAGAGRPVEPSPLQPGGPPVLCGSLTGPGDPPRRALRRWHRRLRVRPRPGRDRDGVRRRARRVAGGGSTRPPRLVTGCWFALGPRAREQLDEYLRRYLAFLGPGVAPGVAPLVRATSAAALRQVVREVADAGADELCLVPTTTDPRSWVASRTRSAPS